ncbi:type I glutamate--ammonia ligase [Fusibacter tunisiensis]|uniref:glutamine synthetase n=1 Tax=Fusibacter tunisiensis TaxID=1008308 RepID=A0ABS2MSJ4_9FIRM|nr:glutamine synthetase [Fusibacter tunisiensis]MBM7562386.1 glutamine synthetase [Fusibacter tunisiensis]
MENTLYTIKDNFKAPDQLSSLLKQHPEIQFVSLFAVDFGNNHTDEKIPINRIIDDLESFLKKGIQTDGSSVYLPEIATINNAKVDLIPDMDAQWIVDYNKGHPLPGGGFSGTLIIPSFLYHENVPVCSRSVLKRSSEHFKSTILKLLKDSPEYLRDYPEISNFDEIEAVALTSATELEFWVKTPDTHMDIEKLSASQHLKEQYWKRTYGQVRTAMEETLLTLEHYGFEPEMGHKEVGGVTSKLAGTNTFTHIMEQLEIDWTYDETLRTADKEIIAKDIIKDVFEAHGLNVTFQAKPLEGVAGSGEHHHVGVALKLKDGKNINLFSPKDMTSNFLSKLGYGALMGILKNYEVINPFVSSTNDSLNRLKPGFEAPVCIVSSLGHAPQIPSRNRTVLIGLIRDLSNTHATRFELRSPNPNSNSYLLLAALYQAKLDGIQAVIHSNATLSDIESAFNKKAGEPHFYLETPRVYRSEKDVFEDYSSSERDALFGVPPKTVYENLLAFGKYPEKVKVLMQNDIFSEKIVRSYRAYMLSEWSTELKERIIPTHIRTIRRLDKLHGNEEITDLDVLSWEYINRIRHSLMKDSVASKSLFTQIREALDAENYDLASNLQIEMNDQMGLLLKKYLDYRRNLMITNHL